jgi:hypothetical protein
MEYIELREDKVQQTISSEGDEALGSCIILMLTKKVGQGTNTADLYVGSAYFDSQPGHQMS